MLLFDPSESRPIHFMGVAGAGMSALAQIALRRGVGVSGCDIDPRDVADLVAAGAQVVTGHDAAHVRDARAVVHTSAVPLDHPELRAAVDLGIPVLKRAEALAMVVSGARVVAIAGTHGKTTTTAMTTEALAAAGLRPTGIVGGRVAAWSGNAKIDGSDLFVVEADEYDRSFLALTPTIAVVNNLEADHLECYGDMATLRGAFKEFAQRASRVLIGADDAGAMQLAGELDSPVWTVGLAEDADVRVMHVEMSAQVTRATLRFPTGPEVALELVVPGLHNLRNAAMAVAAARALDADGVLAASALGSFGGVGRRFDIRGTHRGVTVVDDYAHHPSEVAATLAAARQRFPGRPLIAVFQPHLYSRTREHAAAFGRVLAAADRVVVTEIYPAREQPIPGVTGQSVVEAVRAAGRQPEWVGDHHTLAAFLLPSLVPGDVVITLGAGNITDTATNLLERLAGAAA